MPFSDLRGQFSGRGRRPRWRLLWLRNCRPTTAAALPTPVCKLRAAAAAATAVTAAASLLGFIARASTLNRPSDCRIALCNSAERVDVNVAPRCTTAVFVTTLQRVKKVVLGNNKEVQQTRHSNGMPLASSPSRMRMQAVPPPHFCGTFEGWTQNQSLRWAQRCWLAAAGAVPCCLEPRRRVAAARGAAVQRRMWKQQQGHASQLPLLQLPQVVHSHQPRRRSSKDAHAEEAQARARVAPKTRQASAWLAQAQAAAEREPGCLAPRWCEVAAMQLAALQQQAAVQEEQEA